MGKKKLKLAATQSEDIPDHIKQGCPKKGLEGVRGERLPWISEDGKLDPDVILQECGYDQHAPLIYILSAIIEANPMQDSGSNTTRLEVTLAALIGEGSKRGMDELDDYNILLDVAWNYVIAFYAGGLVAPQVQPIVRSVVERLPEKDRRRIADPESVVRRISRKFRKDKNLLLARVTGEYNPDRRDKMRAINKVLRQLNDLGIKTGRAAPAGRESQRDTKPGQ